MERNERLTTLRILNGLTQDLLSTKSGLPRGSISIWEKGNNAPSHDAVPKLSAALNVPSGYLMYGSPSLDAAVWQPMVPAPRHFPLFAKEWSKNIPTFCEENQITRFAWYQGDVGRVIFLGKADRPYSFLLLQKPELDRCISKALESLEGHEIKGLDFYPPFDVGFLEEMDVEHLKRFVRLAQNSNFEVDGDIITTEFLKAKQNLGLTSDSEYKSFASNAYIHMRVVLDELEKPLDWRPATLNPRYPTLIENESAIFESLFEVCEQKTLIWTGELNEELADIVRKYLKAHGYKEKK
jgi:transcriptional regulator with XRE-family HTH domain